MGRVSNALERSSEERDFQDVASESNHVNSVGDNRTGMSQEGNHGAVNGASGKDHTIVIDGFVDCVGAGERNVTFGHVSVESTVIALETLASPPVRRLRERIEEFLLGWGLEKITSFPLLVLQPASPIAEQYKILREQIRRISKEAGAPMLAITSAAKGDGKTTVAANLAAATALDHERPILLIDADLRNPTIHKYFGVQPKPGLADYLMSNSSKDVTNYIYKSSMAGLRILPGGSLTNRSSELLTMEKMSRLMKELPILFPGHLIVLDTSPVLSTSDSIAVAQLVDRIVFVVRAGATPRTCVSEAIKSLGSDKLISFILNGAELGSTSRYYYSYSP